MNDYTTFHEVEGARFMTETPRAVKPVAELLRTRFGARFHDTMWSVDRKDHPPWQGSIISMFELFRGEARLSRRTGTWDALVASYFLPSLPRDLIPAYLDHVRVLEAELRLPPRLHGAVTDVGSLNAHLQRAADEVESLHAPLGSEELRILIQLTYPRVPKVAS